MNFAEHFKLKAPIVMGAMYPCSNPELVAAGAKAGIMSIVQPLSFTYTHGWDLAKALRFIGDFAPGAPYGMNVLSEGSSKIYRQKLEGWVDVALEHGCRFFVTAMGNPAWVVRKVAPFGAEVYHDVTERKWALKARDVGVNGLICVNSLAGGHAGALRPEALLEDLRGLALPFVCAGGVSTVQDYRHMLDLGYDAVQMGTRFIATTECSAPGDYKQAIVHATAKDIVLTEKISGVPVSVINNDYVKSVGTVASVISKKLLTHPRFKHWMRGYYALKSLRTLSSAWRKKGSSAAKAKQGYYLAGKSVEGVESIESVSALVERFVLSESRN